MGTNILNKMNSLNTRSFNDYQHLIKEIRSAIDDERSNKPRKIETEEDLSDYYFDRESFDYVIDTYNSKLELFYYNFFQNDELIREVIKTDPSILKEIKMLGLFYFMGFEKSSLDVTYGPSSFDKLTVREGRFKDNFDSGYYNKPRSTYKSNKKEGCFIATYAYDNYNHPDVLILRSFRDTLLYKSILGRWFIKTYYFLSPKLVSLLKWLKIPKSLIRKFILPLVLLINKNFNSFKKV
jgi:hypothetical protein